MLEDVIFYFCLCQRTLKAAFIFEALNEFFHIFTEIAIHDIGTEDSEYALDYLYTHNDEEWRSRKIAIGRRRNRFEVKMHFS